VPVSRGCLLGKLWSSSIASAQSWRKCINVTFSAPTDALNGGAVEDEDTIMDVRLSARGSLPLLLLSYEKAKEETF